MMKKSNLWIPLLGIGLSSCGGDTEEKKPSLPLHEQVMSDPELEKGRQIWLKTCMVCHLQGLAGSPPIGNQAAWKPRIAKGMDVLFKHAIEGFDSPEGNHMPAKGGNPALTDEEVKLAVKYVTSVSQ
jgi:cytochrome c5